MAEGLGRTLNLIYGTFDSTLPNIQIPSIRKFTKYRSSIR